MRSSELVVFLLVFLLGDCQVVRRGMGSWVQVVGGAGGVSGGRRGISRVGGVWSGEFEVHWRGALERGTGEGHWRGRKSIRGILQQMVEILCIISILRGVNFTYFQLIFQDILGVNSCQNFSIFHIK